MRNKIDNHKACKSGLQSEAIMQDFIRGMGFRYHTTAKQLKEADINPYGTLFHTPPPAWPQLTKGGKQRKYIADGFIQLWLGNACKGVIIEQKNSDKHGTTEEKVFYDLAKIRNNVYGDRHALWYVFTGSKAKSLTVYQEFAIEAQSLPVKVIWGYRSLAQHLMNLDHYWLPASRFQPLTESDLK